MTAKLKKEFVTDWTRERAEAWGDISSFGVDGLDGLKFFWTDIASERYSVILPKDISFSDLYSFVGKRTRVTIEEID